MAGNAENAKNSCKKILKNYKNRFQFLDIFLTVRYGWQPKPSLILSNLILSNLT